MGLWSSYQKIVAISSSSDSVCRTDSWPSQCLQLLQWTALRALNWIRSYACLLWKLLEASWVFLTGLTLRLLLRIPSPQCLPSHHSNAPHISLAAAPHHCSALWVPSLFTLDSGSWGQQSFGSFLWAGFISWAPDPCCWPLSEIPLLPLSVYLINLLILERPQFKF